MSTASELQLFIDAQDHFDRALADEFRENFIVPITKKMYQYFIDLTGREVCARRARKLRRRGEKVMFSRWTENGKCRYVWFPPLVY